MNQEERLQINSETKEMLRKGTIQQVKSKPAEFLNNLFLVNNKVGAHRPVINLKFLNSHTLARFQNGRDGFNKGSNPRKLLFDKDRSKRSLFWDTSRQKLKKIYSFSMGRKFILIPLLMFCPGSSPS